LISGAVIVSPSFEISLIPTNKTTPMSTKIKRRIKAFGEATTRTMSVDALLPGVTIVEGQELTEKARLIKSLEEIELMKWTIRVCERGMTRKRPCVSRHPGTAYDYCSSKAAVNSLMRGLALNWKDQGTTVLMIHPGWTRTSMGRSCAALALRERAVGEDRYCGHHGLRQWSFRR
jgi:NAD(P)-dependent dehydrogenase (short-subunit alcohol dehydrogenase family)